MGKLYLLPLILVLIAPPVRAQYVVTTPTFPKDTGSVAITVDVSKGNKALLNYSATDKVYIHTGVILGNNPTPWDSVPFTWGTANPAAKITSLGNDKYRFTISDIRALYKVPSNVPIKKIAFLFRDEAGSTVQRNADGSDMYIQLYGSELASKFLEPATEPTFVPKAELVQKNVGDNISVAYASNKAALLRLYYDGAKVQETNGTLVDDNIVITTPGNHEIVATATAGAETTADTIRFFVASPVVIAPVPAGIRDGINYEPGDTSVVLVLYAPGKDRASVIGDFNNWTESSAYQMKMSPDAKRFWLRITGLEPGTEYGLQYLVNSTLRIAEPYAEKVLDPDNDSFIPSSVNPAPHQYPSGKTTGIVSIIQTAPATYTWQSTSFVRPDKRTMAVYELLLRDFLAAPNWQTLKDTIGYLKRLGINAIELMPFNEFEGNLSWGYNPSFYFAPDKYYGTKNKLKEFIDLAHQNGIAVIMDIALNHSFGQSPLVQLYFDNANNRPDVSNPWFNPAAKHAFNVGYDMNHESAATKYFTSRVVEHWLKEYRIDGFRFDLSKGFTQKKTCDDAGGNCDVAGWSAYDASRVAIWKSYYDTVQLKSPGAYVILEHFADNSEELTLSNYGMLLWGNINHAFSQATMGYADGSNLENGLFTVRGWNNPHLVTYMESHDEERIMYRALNFGNSNTNYTVKNLNVALRRMEMSTAFLLSMPGPKMIWQFGELGYDYSINTCDNGSVSDNCRLASKPIRWDYQQSFQRNRLFEMNSAMLKLRQHPAYKAAFASNRVDQNLAPLVKSMRLTTDTSNLVVVGNFDLISQSATITFPGGGTYYDYLTGTTLSTTGSPQSITLEPGEYHVYLNRNITNVLTPVLEIPGTAGQLKLSVDPNPAGRSSIVSYELPLPGPVELTLINSQGVKVGALSYSYRATGKYRINLYDMIKSAHSLSKGIYFLRLNFKSYSTVISIFIK
jgi:1,4-alpha-glucan branching enzyme